MSPRSVFALEGVFRNAVMVGRDNPVPDEALRYLLNEAMGMD